MFLHLMCKIIVLTNKISEFEAEFGTQDCLTSLVVSQFQDRGLENLETWVLVITQPVNFASVWENHLFEADFPLSFFICLMQSI